MPAQAQTHTQAKTQASLLQPVHVFTSPILAGGLWIHFFLVLGGFTSSVASLLAAQNSGNEVHELLWILVAFLRERLSPNPPSKNQMGPASPSTQSPWRVAGVFLGAAVGFLIP